MLPYCNTYHYSKEPMQKHNTQDKRPTASSSYENYIEPIPVSCTPSRGKTFEADLHDYITSPAQFSTIVSALGMMEEEDSFVLNLQSGGGSLDATDSVIHAMRKTKGHIHVIATGNCSSAATFILLEADSYELSEGFNSTCHCGSLGSGGAFNEYRQHTTFYNKFMEKTIRSYYEGFLLESELDAMLDGKDIILDSDGWVERYDMRNTYFQEKQKEFEAAMQAEQQKLSCPPFEGNPEECVLPKKVAKKPLKLPKKTSTTAD